MYEMTTLVPGNIIGLVIMITQRWWNQWSITIIYWRTFQAHMWLEL